MPASSRQGSSQEAFFKTAEKTWDPVHGISSLLKSD